MKISKLELLLPIIILIISWFTWKHIPTLQFIGEGYQYFGVWNWQIIGLRSLPHDLFARLASIVLVPIFRQNTYLYMSFVLLVMLLADLLFYLFVRAATNNKNIALLAAFLYSISFVGKYDMFSNGGYQYFLQRGALMPILLTSLIFLDQYIKKERIIFYLVSISIYISAIFLGFFSSWFLPIMFFYPLSYLKSIKKLWIPVSYVVINFLIVGSSGFVPETSLLKFILNDPNFIPGVLSQLVSVTAVFKSSASTLLIYAIALILIRREKRFFGLMLAFLFALMGMLTINMYLNASAVKGIINSSRYFYYPYVCVAGFWGIFLGHLFYSKRLLTKLLVIGFVIFIFITNYQALQKAIQTHSWNHEANRSALAIIASWSKELKKTPSYVYVPTSLGPYGATFAYNFYSHPEGEFFEERIHPLDIEELTKKGVAPQRLYVLHFDPQKQIVVDKTKESRALLIESYLWQNK